MMKHHSTRYRAEQGKRAMHLMVPALFLCFTLFSHAASNIVDGTAYGTNDWSDAGSISSQSDGVGTLEILHLGTTNLTLSHDIEGDVAIENVFDNFTIIATNSSLTGLQSSALTVTGGTNLYILGGYFSATNKPSDGSGPPLPPSSANNIGVNISGTKRTVLDGTTVVGGTDSGIGGPAVQISDGELIITGNSSLTGGAGNPAIYASAANIEITNGTLSAGSEGPALFLSSGSAATIHGGTFISETNQTTFFLMDSDLTLNAGTVSNGIFYSYGSEGATNTAILHDGEFDLLYFEMSTNATQYFTAGSNLTGKAELYQNSGNMSVTNIQSNAFSKVVLFNGASIDFTLDFILPSGGNFLLDSASEQATFSSITIESNATFSAGAGYVSADHFLADSFSTNMLAITDSTNGLIDAQTAHFKTNSILVIDTVGTGLSSQETNEYTLVSANSGQLFAGASTNTPATTESFTNNVVVETLDIEGRTEFSGAQIRTQGGKTILLIGASAMPLEEYWDLASGTSTVIPEAFAIELDTPENKSMLAIIDSYSSPAASLAAVEQTYFTVRNTFQTALNGMQAAVGQSVSRGAEFREQLKLKSPGSRGRRRSRPSGASGPEKNNDLRGWAKYYGQRFHHDADELNPEYNTDIDGGVIGIDKSLGGLLVGIGGGYGRYSTTFGSGGEEEITAYHGMLYGTLGIDKAYIDAGVGYGFNQVENQTSIPFVLNSEFDAQMINAYLGGGIDLVDSKEGMVFTPEASIQYSMYEQDAYSETSDIALPRTIDAFESDSLRGSIGLNVSILDTMKFDAFSLKYDVRAHWIREFNPEPGNMNFSLAGGTETYELAYSMLDEDLYRVGIGCSFFNTKRNQPKNVLFRIDFDELFGDGFNSHNFSGKVIYAF
ncbi:MAG: autotransporter outer membrane beta-barrel domain-containing protein [Verrucomicrobiota bacterium]